MASPTTYLDHAATTPLRPEARAALLEWLGDGGGPGGYGNPSGSHHVARRARRALDDARDELADVVGCRPGEVVFTSGGTEADNLAVTGSLSASDAPRPLAVCSAVEHHAVLDPVHRADGVTVGVDRLGRLDLDDLRRVLASATADGREVALVSVLLANNEVGTVQELDAVADVVDELAPGAALHTDAVQALCWLDLPPRAARADLISLSGHKFGGPQGIGALVVRDGTRLTPMLAGGGQERRRRSGTQNVAGAVAMAAAARATADGRKAEVERIEAERDRLVDGLLAAIPGAVVTAAGPDGGRHHLVAGAAHLCLPGAQSEELLFLLDQEGLCATAGSSCASGALDPSPVLAALGVPPELAAGALRLSLGWTTTGDDVDRALAVVPAAVDRLRRSAAP